MRRVGVATLALIATGCSLLIDSSKYTGGDAGPDRDAGLDGDLVDATSEAGCPDGGCPCNDHDDCDGRREICMLGVCVAACGLGCEEGQYCRHTRCGMTGSGCVDCDHDGDGYVERPDACSGLRPGDCNDCDAALSPGRVPICGNGVYDDCEAFDFSTPDHGEIGRLPPQMLAVLPMAPAQLSLSVQPHRFAPATEASPWEATVVVDSDPAMPVVVGFDVGVTRRRPYDTSLVPMLETDRTMWRAVRITDIEGQSYLAALGIAPGPRAFLFRGVLVGTTPVEQLMPIASADAPEVTEPFGQLGFLDAGVISMVWRRPDRTAFQRMDITGLLAESQSDPAFNTDLASRWVAGDGSLLMAAASMPDRLLLWRGEPAPATVMQIVLPAKASVLSDDADESSGALVQIDGSGRIYVALVPTAANGLLSWYVNCGPSPMDMCDAEPELSRIDPAAGTRIEMISGELLREIIPLTAPGQILAATSAARGDGTGSTLALRYLVATPGNVAERASAELPLDGTDIRRIHAIATANRDVRNMSGVGVGTDFIVAVAVDTGRDRELWTTGARLCDMP